MSVSATFYPLSVKHVRRDTRDSAVLTLEAPTQHKKKFHFRAGQYLNFRETIEGTELRRSYSICAAEQDEYLRVGIKKVPQGVFSSWIHEKVQVGQVLQASPPQGAFNIDINPVHAKHYLALAAGSGITPVLSIIKSALIAEPHSSFTLLYGNRASNGIMFREELEDLKNSYMGRFNLMHIMTREQQDIELFNGRIDKEKCASMFQQWVDITSVDHAFICGPQDMMLEITESLKHHGLDRQQIKFELFAATAHPTKSNQRAQAHARKSEYCSATIIMDGRAQQLVLEKNKRSVLDAALEEGLDLPHACKGGVCSTCKAMLVSGEVDMDAQFALEDYEVERGYILCCQSYPVSKEIVVDFDR